MRCCSERALAPPSAKMRVPPESARTRAVEVSRGELLGVDLDLNHIPDAAMTAAVLALFADGPPHDEFRRLRDEAPVCFLPEPDGPVTGETWEQYAQVLLGSNEFLFVD